MKKIFKIEGMSCNHCVMAVQKNLSGLDLIKYNVRIGSVEVEFDESKTNEVKIIIAIENAGYKVVN